MTAFFRRTYRPFAGFAVAVIAAVFSGCASAPAVTRAEPPSNPYGYSVRTVKAASSISLTEIERYLKSRTGDLRPTRPGVWRMSIDGVLVFIVAESERVRILAPIFALRQLEEEPGIRSALMIRLLQSNFERSIDARYAIFDGIVFATVTHPRMSLMTMDLDSFLTQVVNLHKNTFRTGLSAYSSSEPAPGSVEIDPRQDKSLNPNAQTGAAKEPDNRIML